MARLRIAINALFQASGGSLTNLAQLLSEWGASGALEGQEIVVFASRASEAALRREVPARHLAKIELHVLAAADHGLLLRLWAEQVQMVRRLRAARIDVVFCPGNVVPYATAIPTVVTFQNAAPFCPSVTYRSTGGWKWLRFALLGAFIRASAKRATRVIFISTYFCDLFVREHGFPPERAVVIPRGRIEAPVVARDADYERSLGITGQYILCVSHLNPYKNIVELVKGFVRACERGGIDDRQLVIAGMFNFPWYHRLVVETLNELGGAAKN
ncbi:MAG TPA: glycosyltransferase, partial [Thermoanaerobaculia bacterium]|nr:glycosyltransferase [Thermoanaerobaculia bacterium]